MTVDNIFFALLFIGGVILLGKWVRRQAGFLQRLYLPSSIIGGILALLAGPEVLGRLTPSDGWLATGLWPSWTLEAWSGLPGILISVVFAGLFLGKRMESPRVIWQRAGPMVAHGQTLAWGQYVVGLSLAMLFLTPIFGLSPLSGTLIEISFEGGHGTAAGLADTFRELGFADGADMALGLATIGVVAGTILGTLLINWAVWKGHMPSPDKPSAEKEQTGEDEILSEHETRESVPEQTAADKSVDPLSIHLGFIALSIGVGWLLLQGLIHGERLLLMPLGWPELMVHIPLFPLAMIGGVLVQIAGDLFGYSSRIDRTLINRISGTALDFLIVAAMATISLEAIGSHLWPFLLLALAGIAWNLIGFFVLARLLFPRHWVTYGLANFGQGIGMTVIGLLLVRMSDPRGRTGAMEAFGYKQLLFEPIVGGGIFTAASLPLVAQFGPGPVLAGVSVLCVGWLIFGLIQFRRLR